MNNIRIASCAATLFALAVTFGVNAQNDTCANKNHYILDYAGTPWIATGNLNAPRFLHTATLLPDGKVLVVGGFGILNIGDDAFALDSAELYDPTTGIWTVTGSLTQPRGGHTATLLPGGKVLVVGGGYLRAYGISDGGTAELYDSATGTWTPTGSLNTPRVGFTATLLATGQVLVAGGVDKADATLTSAELYDPSTETWSFTGDLVTGRFFQTATPLQDGRILVVGGWTDDFFGTSTNRVELYNPITGIWTSSASLSLALSFHTATRLPDGKVLVAGGYRVNHISIPGSPGIFYVPTSLDEAEFFDPISGTWETVANLNGARHQHTATLLPDGKVLVAGGYDYHVGQVVSGAEMYDAATNTWTNAASLASPRSGHTATLLPDDTVLIAGGSGLSGSPAISELYAGSGTGGCQ